MHCVESGSAVLSTVFPSNQQLPSSLSLPSPRFLFFSPSLLCLPGCCPPDCYGSAPCCVAGALGAGAAGPPDIPYACQSGEDASVIWPFPAGMKTELKFKQCGWFGSGRYQVRQRGVPDTK